MKATTRRDYQERILRVLLHIQEHLDDELSLDGLAELAHFSSYHFHRMFRGMVGESVMAHVRRLRLERAAQRLRHTGRSVGEIALEAGYESNEAFTRAFRSRFEESPSEYRQGTAPCTLETASGVHYAEDGQIEEFHPHRTTGDPMEVKVEEFTPRRVAFIRHTGPYQDVGKVWDQIFAWAGPRGLVGPDTLAIGVCYDDPEVTPPEKIRYDACLTVAPNVEGEGEIGIQTIDGGSFATTIHQGPYENLAATYARLVGEEVPRHELELRAAPCLEIYRNSCHDTEPEDLITDVMVPVT